MSKIVCFSTVIIFVAAINVILLGTITTQLLYAQHDDNSSLTVHKLIASFPFIPPTTSPHQTMAGLTPAISNASQSSTNETASNGNSAFLTYKNPTYGIQIQYPSSWIKLANKSSNEIVRFMSPPGTVRASLGNYIQAIPYLDKALAIDPNFKVALTGKGYVLNGLGNYTQAIPYLDKALAIDPNYKDALTGKGVSLNGLDNYTQAIEYYDKALAIDPNDKFI